METIGRIFVGLKDLVGGLRFRVRAHVWMGLKNFIRVQGLPIWGGQERLGSSGFTGFGVF